MATRTVLKNELMLSHWKRNSEDVLRMMKWSLRNPFPPVQEGGELKRRSYERSKQQERLFGNDLIRVTRTDSSDNTGQWTTVAVESLVEFILTGLYGKVWRPKYTCGHVGVRPDFETKMAIFEVKAQTWNGGGGTAGEKIFAVPWKYGELAQTLNKPVCIILVAAQEEEVRKKYGMFGGKLGKHHATSLRQWEAQNIHFMPFSRLLKFYCKRKSINFKNI
tara:strand:+ start:36 stop:695 length:660 start_codon:yes stop_codon:yes gene_type:complete